jgi:hypothetical protein
MSTEINKIINKVEVINEINKVEVINEINKVEVINEINKVEIVKDGTLFESNLNANFDKNFSLKTTDDLTEGTNKFTSAEDIAKLATIEEGADVSTVFSVNNLTGDVVTQITDTRANILILTPEYGTTAFSTDTSQYYVYNDGNWREFSSTQALRASNYDIGYEQESNLSGYGSDYITDKRISNCTIGENYDNNEGGARVTYADSLGKTIAQYYLDGGWKTVLTGVNIQTDHTENPIDIEFTDFKPYYLSLINGNSDVKDLNGVPMVQDMKIDMGVHSSPLIIDGGNF